MARTIDQIKEDIAANFMNNESAADAFGFERGSSFNNTFSKVSIVNILFYTFAAAAWLVESLFDEYSTEVDARIEEIIPHRPKWYRDKMLNFMKGLELVKDSDYYDTSDMSAQEIDEAKVIKHAVATENEDSSILTVKVAGENNGVRQPLDEETEKQLVAYIAEVKDAGVRINLVNIAPDIFNCTVDVFYNPLLLPETVENDCRRAIIAYIENLPFNGEYTNMALVDALQAVSGVRIVEFQDASVSVSGESTVTPIDARIIPAAGYFAAGDITINMKVHE